MELKKDKTELEKEKSDALLEVDDLRKCVALLTIKDDSSARGIRDLQSRVDELKKDAFPLLDQFRKCAFGFKDALELALDELEKRQEGVDFVERQREALRLQLEGLSISESSE